MRIGLNLPQAGRLADPATSRSVAVAAEAAGFDSLWVLDRLLAPVQPRSPYPGTADGSLPEDFRRVLDPLGVLTLATAVTQQVRLGTNVLVAPWYPPVALARSLATLDLISSGRLDVGLGLGWSEDEYEAVGVPRRRLGERLEDFLDVLDAAWGDEIVAHDGPFTRIAPSTIAVKPIQRPRPPVLLAAFTPGGLERIARRADGWLPVGIPHEVLAQMWAGVRHQAADHGRDPGQLRLVVRANVKVTDSPLADDRPVFCGTRAQITADVEATRALGADELVLDLHADASTGEELLELATSISAEALVTTGPPRAGRRSTSGCADGDSVMSVGTRS